MTLIEKLDLELRWHEDRIEVYDEKARERFAAMRVLIDKAR